MGVQQAARTVLGLQRAQEIFWNALSDCIELGLSEDAAEQWTRFHYARVSKLYRQPAYNRQGLYAWEAKAVQAYFPDPPARILVPGAGGGREVLALLERGYTVVALEPDRHCCQHLRVAAAGRGDVQIFQADHQSLTEAPIWNDGSLVPFDAVMVGWGSLSHVVKAEDLRVFIATLARLCPHGPLLVSFLVNTPPMGLTDRRKRFRRLAARGFGRRASDEPLRFDSRFGLVRVFDRIDLEALAGACGRSLALYHGLPQGHALLVTGSP